MFTGSVKIWYKHSYPSWGLQWEKFVKDFHLAYSVGNRYEALKAQARTVRQADDEPIMNFVHRKLGQLEEFYPVESASEHFCTIIALVNDKYARYLCGRHFDDYQSFQSACIHARDIVEKTREGQLVPLSYSDDPMELQKVKTGYATKPVSTGSGKQADRPMKVFQRRPNLAPPGGQNRQFRPTQPTLQRFNAGQNVPRRVPGTPAAAYRPTGTAGYVQRTGQQPATAGAVRKPFKCFNCHKLGHMMRDCAQPPNSENRRISREFISAFLDQEDEDDILVIEEEVEEILSETEVSNEPAQATCDPIVDIAATIEEHEDNHHYDDLN